MTILIALILLGIILMLVELLLIPGVGVAGICSVLSLLSSCWYAFAALGTTAGIVTTIIVCILLVAMTIIILRAKTWKRFELKTEIDSRVNTEGDAVKEGDKGVTVTRLAPMGTARIGQTVCEVKSADNSMVGPSVPVEVVGIEDNKILVKPISE